jgi:hypothetical protein
MADPNAFAKLVPGFDFLQNLMGGAASAVPGMSSWVAPTLDPAELDKRIDELRTVQFWLEQNARMIATTIQALEVQRMTLSTLRQMNLSIGDMAQAMQLPVPAPAPAPKPAPAPMFKAAQHAPPPAPAESKSESSAAPAAEQPAAAAGIVDPMQWWGALTQQFTALAAKAVRESSGDARAAPRMGPGSAAAGAAEPAATTSATTSVATSAAKPSAKRPAARKAAAKAPRAPAARRPARSGP